MPTKTTPVKAVPTKAKAEVKEDDKSHKPIANVPVKTVPVKSGTKEEGKCRKQMAKVLDIDMSTSRARNHLDKFNINSDIEEALTELRSKKTNAKVVLSDATKSVVTKAYETVFSPRKARHDTAVANANGDAAVLKSLGDAPKRTDSIDEQIEYVSKMRWRFSNNSRVVLASALDYILEVIVESAMVNARADNKSIIHLRHAVMGNFKDLPVYPLVERLSVVQDALSAATKDEKEDEKVEADDVEDEGDDNAPNFRFYVQQKCKRVKARLSAENDTYKSIRVAFDFRQDGSDIVIQLIKRLAPLIKLYATTANVKTVDEDVIKFVLKMIMLDSGSCCKDLSTFIDDRLKMFKEYKA